MATKFKFKLRRLPSRDLLNVTVLVGEENTTLQNAGTLTLRIGEWQLFGAAMLIGKERTQGHLVTETEGEREALQ